MKTMEIDEICRACLRKEDKMIDMSEKEIYQKFLLFANLTDKEDIPDISLNLCQSCEQKLENSLKFQEECQKSHETLLKYVKNTRNIDSEAPIPLNEERRKKKKKKKTREVAIVKRRSHIKVFSQSQVSEAIKELRPSYYKTLNCIRCRYVGSNSKAVAQHISRMHKDLKPRWCSVCNAEFDNLTHHIATNHNDVYTCKFCSKKFQSIRNIIEHLHIHSDLKPFRCLFCNESFTENRRLEMHLKMHKSEGVADKQLAALLLKKKMRGKVSHKCTYCEKKFKAACNLVRHERTHTGEKPYVCQICGRGFPLNYSLKEHMKVHNIGSSNISCNICDKKFIRLDHLNVHLRWHTGEKPFVCTKCGKAYRRRSDLLGHNKTHTDLCPYECHNCGKSFKLKSRLIGHMSTHSEEKPYKCNQCAYAGRNSSNLANHMKTHKVDKPEVGRPHMCLMCNRTFTTNAVLMSHINRHNVSFLEIK